MHHLRQQGGEELARTEGGGRTHIIAIYPQPTIGGNVTGHIIATFDRRTLGCFVDLAYKHMTYTAAEQLMVVLAEAMRNEGECVGDGDFKAVEFDRYGDIKDSLLDDATEGTIWRDEPSG